MQQKLLPIGSVIELKDKVNIPLMIIGYKPTKEDGSVKDYAAVIYPIGCIDNKTFLIFDHTEIAKVIFEGYSNQAFDTLKQYFSQSSPTETR